MNQINKIKLYIIYYLIKINNLLNIDLNSVLIFINNLIQLKIIIYYYIIKFTSE